MLCTAARWDSPVPLKQSHIDHQFSLSVNPSHIHPSKHRHQALSYSAQESPPLFPGKAGPFPQEAAQNKAQNQAIKFLFSEAVHCSAKSSVPLSKRQETCLTLLIWCQPHKLSKNISSEILKALFHNLNLFFFKIPMWSHKYCLSLNLCQSMLMYMSLENEG